MEVSRNEIFIKGSDLIHQPESQLRNWLRKHGKHHCIDFSEEQLEMLH
jgi:hypothetical protein